jgi:hypothetical protein
MLSAFSGSMPITTVTPPRTVRPSARARVRCLVMGVAGIVLTACGGGGDLTKQLATARSWTATMQLARAERRAGAITTTYSTQLADAARQALGEVRSTLPSVAVDSSSAHSAAASLDSLDRAIRALDVETRQ